MASQEVKIGIIGAGANTRLKHIPGLQAIDGVEIVGLCNRSPESSQKVADQFGIKKTYDHWRHVIDDPATNAIVVGTWPYMHCRCTLAALKAGKHILTEARMAANATEARRMLHAAQRHPLLTAQIVPVVSGAEKTAQRMIADGELGDILAVEYHADSGAFLDRESPLHWRQNFDLNGMNIRWLGTTYEVILRCVGHATRVLAAGQTFVKTRRNADGQMATVRVPEHLDVIADMECGAQLHIQQSDISALMDGGGTYFFGSEATLRLNGDELHGGRRGDSQLKPIKIPADEKLTWRVEEEFINAVRGLEPVRYTPFDVGVKYMEFTEAVTRSVATGQAVHLPLTLND